LENFHFGTAEFLALLGGGADGTVVFDEEEGAVGLVEDFGHVAFLGAEVGDRANSGLPAILIGLFCCEGTGDFGLVGLDLALTAIGDQAIESGFTKDGLDAAEDIEHKVGVAVGEVVARSSGELPKFDGATEGTAFLLINNLSFGAETL
jgi:hypothetical protein